MILLILIILIISFFDLRPMFISKQRSDIICFTVIALGCILYGYYYNTHMYTASVIGFILKLFKVN